MGIKITGNGLTVTKHNVKGVIHRVNNPNPMWKKVGSYLSMVNRKQFATHGAYLGKPWKPLKPEYLQWKVKNGYSRKTLVKTGALKISYTSRPMSIEKYMGDSAIYGSDNELAGYHYYGTRRNGKRAIPPRPVMRNARKVSKAIKAIATDYLMGNNPTVRKYM
jgi:phage virion morphogenesis protein